MHWRVGFSGLALVAAFVVGGVAQQPVQPPPEWGSEGTVLPPRWDAGLQVEPESGQQVVPQGLTLPTPEIAQVASAGEIIGFNGYDGSGSQTITLVHTGKLQIAVYHIDSSGIVLISSRPITDDFSLTFNATEPLPGQIRLLNSPVK